MMERGWVRAAGRGALLLGLMACSGGSERKARPEVPTAQEKGWGDARLTQARRYEVALELLPDPPPRGELFSVRAFLRDRDGNVIENAKVELDARMPHHDHGMETEPINAPGVCDEEGSCTHPGGIYNTSGFKFHMGGAWTITVNIPEGPRGPDRTSFVYFLE